MSRLNGILATLALILVSMSDVHAQSKEENAAVLDSLDAFRPVMVDSTLLGKNIFNVLPSMYNGHRIDVKIQQSQAIMDAMMQHVELGKDRVISGYRVRIYFDNKQDSRKDSEELLMKFRRMYPEIPAYRSYQNPFFKVTVGDYRTKSEAMFLLNVIKQNFPSAFVVKDEIQFPL